MISIILTAGKGERLGLGYNKSLIIKNGKTLLQYHIEEAKKISSKIIVVVGYDKENVISTCKDLNKNIIIIEQKNNEGLIGALKVCREEIKDEDVVLFLGDEYYVNRKLKDMIKFFKDSKSDFVCGFIRTRRDRIPSTYTVKMFGNIVHWTKEKPSIEEITNNYMGTGTCVIKNSSLSYLFLSPRNLSDWMMLLLEMDKSVNGFEIADYYLNINTQKDLEELSKF